jgi:hypothetical protein
MAFLVKRQHRQSSSSAAAQSLATVDQFIQVSTAARTLPATTTDQIFRVYGGRIILRALIGQVTTICSATATNLKVSSKALSNAAAAVGTAVDLAANLAIANAEVGALWSVEGDGTALVGGTAGAAVGVVGLCILPQGEIYLTTSATNTGAAKWDIYYQPLDAGAYVESVVAATAAI